jgi:hypothetical protein
MLKFPDIKATNNVVEVTRAIQRQRYSKGLSPWFPGADTLDIMPMIVEVDEPSELSSSNEKKFTGKLKRRNTVTRQRELGIRKSSITPILRSVMPITPRNSGAGLDRKSVLKRPTKITRNNSESFDFAKFVESLDKITLPKLERPSSNSSLISKYSSTSSGNSSYARSDASTITLRDIDGISLEPEDSISRVGLQDTSVMDLEDDEMADLADDVAFALTPPLRFGASLSREASMAMLMEYEDTLKNNMEDRRIGARSPLVTSTNPSGPRSSLRYDPINSQHRDSPTGSGANRVEQRFSQRQLNKKMHRAMSLLDKVKQIEQESVARNSPIPQCYSPRGILSPSKWTRNW